MKGIYPFVFSPAVPDVRRSAVPDPAEFSPVADRRTVHGRRSLLVEADEQQTQQRHLVHRLFRSHQLREASQFQGQRIGSIERKVFIRFTLQLSTRSTAIHLQRTPLVWLLCQLSLGSHSPGCQMSRLVSEIHCFYRVCIYQLTLLVFRA